jgi:tetratricopeptide (TPR) repeat protein
MAGDNTPKQSEAEDLENAIAHHRAGRLDQAEVIYRKLLTANPGHPRGLHLLGVIETQRGRPDRGAELIAQALTVTGGAADLHFDLGNALRLAGKPEEAVESYRRSLALKPDYSRAHVAVAGVLSELGRFEAAVSHSRSAVAIEPASLTARLALAGTLQAAGRLPETAQAWREIIALDPARADSYYQLAGRLIVLGLVKEALYCQNKAISLNPENPLFYCARGQSMMRLSDGEGAAASFRAALAIAPDLKEGWLGLSWSLRMLGRFDEADQCIRRLREIDPTDLRAVRHVPSTGRLPQQPDVEIDQLSAVMERPDSTIDDRISAGFALARLLDEAGRFDEAFSTCATANTLMRRKWPANGDRFDAAAFTRTIDAMINQTAELDADPAAGGSVSELPVFVVGMPRSGTTLVEQICASHSRVFGAGELDDMSRIAATLSRQRRDQAQLASAARQAADAYVVRLHRLGRGALRVVDKMPDNVVLLGLIARLFPRARIVYCSRDARDISLSCFFQLFAEGAQYFSYDLIDCGRRCRDVGRLAAHWLKLLPLQMIEVNYERLIADPERESSRLIEFLELDWEPACLDFHQTERTVATVSHWQVRQPIYTSSIGRWRNYEKHLTPLFDALEGRPEQATAA